MLSTTFVRAHVYARARQHPDLGSGQTHDDRGWLDEKDGEQDVRGDGAERLRRNRRHASLSIRAGAVVREHNAWAEDGAGDDRAERWS